MQIPAKSPHKNEESLHKIQYYYNVVLLCDIILILFALCLFAGFELTHFCFSFHFF